jgi:hypothetical protein
MMHRMVRYLSPRSVEVMREGVVIGIARERGACERPDFYGYRNPYDPEDIPRGYVWLQRPGFLLTN